METLKMLKFHLKKEHLNFTDSWVTPTADMLQDEPEGDLLHQLLEGNATEVQDGFDLIIQSIDTNS